MLVTSDLIARLARSNAVWLARAVRAAGGDVLEIAGGTAAFCGAGNVLTQAVGIGIERDPSDQEWENLLAHFRGRCERFELAVSPLAKEGFRRRAVQVADDVSEFGTVLVRETDGPIPDSPSVSVEELPKEEARAFVALSAPWFFPDGAPPGFEDTIVAASSIEGSHTFVVRVAGDIVAGATLVACDGIGRFMGGGVAPAHRGRGYHRALIAHRIRVARDLGLPLVSQGAEPGTVSQLNAQRNGFSIAAIEPVFWVRPQPV
ncbi:MAG: GNAT family N-acetyltransferase [Fimbriimonadaceae bacterium]|nr:GNAT family N-acetyltransferase [Fimbriimonadaceae bacterium]